MAVTDHGKVLRQPLGQGRIVGVLGAETTREVNHLIPDLFQPVDLALQIAAMVGKRNQFGVLVVTAKGVAP